MTTIRPSTLGLYCFWNPMTIIIDREYSRSILFSEPYDYYFIDREVLSVNIVIEPVSVFFFCCFFLFPPVQSTHATAKSNNSIIFKFLVLIQQYQAQV